MSNSMVHTMLLFYIVIMATISVGKNVEWVAKKVVQLREWWHSRHKMKVEYLAPVR